MPGDPGGLSAAPLGHAELGLFFLVGLFGAGHCLGMCGPLVSLYADRLDDGADSTRLHLGQHALFNLGRTASYALLGAVFGLLGGAVFAGASTAVRLGDVVRGLAGVVVGGVVVAAGLGYVLGWQHAVLSGDIPLFGPVFDRVHGAILEGVEDWVGGRRIVGLGMAHGVLPCPLLYPAFLYALGRGSAVEGGLALAALGAGTVPAVFLYGTLYQSASPRSSRLVHRLLGAAFVLLGVHTLLVGLGVLGVDVPRLFSIPIYQPLTGEGVRQVPVVVALLVAGIGSVLLLGAAAVSLARRRSASYLLITLALLAFALQIGAAQLAYLSLIDAEASRQVDYLADAGVAVLVVGAVYYVTRVAREPGGDRR